VGPGYPIQAVTEEDEAWNFMVIFSKKDRYVFQKRLLWFFILKLWENNIGLIKFFLPAQNYTCNQFCFELVRFFSMFLMFLPGVQFVRAAGHPS
jgi:hypothetical protein